MSAPARSGLVAVLFTDLVGSTELMTQLGERKFDEVRREHFAVLGRVVAAHGGEEVKNTGDGILAVFGSAGEAVEAAVAMQQATVRQRSPVPLAMRVGVAVGDATLEDGDVFGTPVVEAARLVAVAQPGQILTTGIVRALAARADVRFEDVGDLELKGLPEPIPACEVAWEPLAQSVIPMPALLTAAGRVFVGRDSELERIGQLWKEAVAGERRVALLAGEPGIGKTRLASVAARRSYDEGAVVLAGRCDEDLGVPYQPFVEALRHYVVNVGAEARLGRHGGELVRLVPEAADAVSGLAPPLRSDPETERYRLFDAVAAWLADLSQESPVLLVLDDLQWAAKPTLLLLRHVVRNAEGMSLLIVGTYRDSDVGRGHPLSEFLADLRREAGVERLSLTGLDAPGVADYLIKAAGHDLDEAGEELARAVWRETEGLPFFVAEVMRHLVESGGVEQRAGRWVVTAGVEDLGIPEGVRDVVGRRLSRLSEDANRVLACASVAGLEFEPAVVQTAGRFDETTVIAALHQAVASRLLVEVPGPVPRNRFSHALVRATLYDELTATGRVAWHRKVADTIETLHAQALDDHLPALAHHWSRAAVTTKAVEYVIRAGDRALAQLAHDEAAAYYRQALELLKLAPGLAKRQRLPLLIALGEAERRAGDKAHRETLLRAVQLAADQGDGDALARAALANTRGMYSSTVGEVDHDRVAALEAALNAVEGDETPTRARLLAALAAEITYTGDRERRLRLADEALAIARRIGDVVTLAHVLLQRFFSSNPFEVLEELVALTEELVSLSERLDDPVVKTQALWLRGRVLAQAGDMEEANHRFEAAEHLTEELGQPTLRWLVGTTATTRTILAGDLEEGERRAQAGFEVGRATGQRDAAAFLAVHLFLIRLEQDRLGELEETLADVVAAVPGLPTIRAYLTRLLCELDRPEEAFEHYEVLATENFIALPRDPAWTLGVSQCAAVAASLGDRVGARVLFDLLAPYASQIVFTNGGSLGAVAHYLAVLAATFGDFDEAERRFADAASTHDRIGAPTWLARTRLEWARMLLTGGGRGDEERARELLGQALATARELGLANLERRSVELLR